MWKGGSGDNVEGGDQGIMWKGEKFSNIKI